MEELDTRMCDAPRCNGGAIVEIIGSKGSWFACDDHRQIVVWLATGVEVPFPS